MAYLALALTELSILTNIKVIETRRVRLPTDLIHSFSTMQKNIPDSRAYPMSVQYGCGWSAPPGWLNFDSSPTLRLERLPVLGQFIRINTQRFPEGVVFGDVVKGLPIPPSSVSYLYCSHVLEHLALDDCRRALKESFRLLRPGGTFRLVVPDLESEIREYQLSIDPGAGNHFLESTMLGTKSRARGIFGFLRSWLGGSKHLWMWDFKGLKHELEMIGFVEVRRAAYGDSPIAEYEAVEDQSRWSGCLGIDCCKPI